VVVSEGRYELKYALPRARRADVLAAAVGFVQPDHHGESLERWLPDLRLPGGGPPVGYKVSSLYLDDASFDGYAQRIDDLPIRNRVRIRTYGEPGETAPVFLEAKRKLRSLVVKHRVRVGDTDGWARLPGPRPWTRAAAAASPAARHLVRRWVEVVDAAEMDVVCRVEYLRETFVCGTARLTLDHHVRAAATADPHALRGPCDVALLPPDWFVLELKFNGAKPVWMRDLVREVRLCAEPVSKFALGVALAVRSDSAADARRFLPPSLWHHCQAAAR